MRKRESYPRTRDPYFDNAKLLLITLVVLGHTVEPLVGRVPLAKATHVFIYAFHMPAFVFIAGLFSRPTVDARRGYALLRSVVIPYALFEVGLSVFDYYVFHRKTLVISPATPYWVMWFLMSLLWWRLLLPLFAGLRAWAAMSLAVVLSLAAGLTNDIGYHLSASRTLTMLPFFIAGFLAGPSRARQLTSPTIRGAAVLVLVAGAWSAWVLSPHIDVRWLYGSFSFGSLGHPGLPGMTRRLGVLAAGAALGAAVLSLTPTRELRVSPLGERTLFVFLAHAFVVKWALAHGWFARVHGTTSSLLLLAGIAVTMTLFLASRPVDRVFGWVLDPNLSILRRPKLGG